MTSNPYSKYYTPAEPVPGAHHYTDERKLPIDVFVVDTADRPKWERLFLRSYLRYLPLSNIELKEMGEALGINEETGLKYKRQQAGNLVMMMRYRGDEAEGFGPHIQARLDEIKNVLDLNWQKFTKDKDTLCVIAKPSYNSSRWPDDLKDSIKEHEVVGLGYATICRDMVYGGERVAKVEGTYVPSDYRSRGIGTEMLKQLAKQLRDDYGVKEMFFWTHHRNPHTQNIYPNLKADDENQFAALQTNEEMLVLGLNDARRAQYEKVTENPIPEMEEHLKKEILASSKDYVVTPIVTTDEEQFKGLFKEYLRMEISNPMGQVDDAALATKSQKVWDLLAEEDSKVRGFLLKTRTGEVVGMGIIQGDIKLPRDSFLTAQATIFINHEHRGYASVRTLMSHLAEEALNLEGVEALRWVMQKNNPHLPFTKTEMELHRTPIKPVIFPFNTYRMSLSPECVYQGQAAAPNALQQQGWHHQ